MVAMSDIISLQMAAVDLLNPDKPSPLDYPFLFISLFGDWRVLGGMTALVFLQRRDAGKRLALLFLVTMALLVPLKLIIQEPRPPVVSDEIRGVGGVGDSSSFPSGHATLAFAYASLLTWTYGRGRCFYSFALLIALSRIYLGQHYPLDIAFGAGLGLLSAHLTKFIYRKGEESSWKP
jgi:undecaprenyl-diphosphatase